MCYRCPTGGLHGTESASVGEPPRSTAPAGRIKTHEGNHGSRGLDVLDRSGNPIFTGPNPASAPLVLVLVLVLVYRRRRPSSFTFTFSIYGIVERSGRNGHCVGSRPISRPSPPPAVDQDYGLRLSPRSGSPRAVNATGRHRIDISAEVISSCGRVAPGGCPPGAPTDPDVRVDASGSSESRLRCSTVDRVDHHRRRQGIAREQLPERSQDNRAR